VALLIVLGLVETAALIAAIFNKTSFAGGSILYIYAGWRLSRKDARTYNVVVIWLSVFLALLVGGVFFSGVNAIQIALTPGLHLDVTGDLPLLFVGFVYIAVIPVLLALLFHPATRNEFGKPIRGTSPWTLYLSVPNLVGLSIAGMLLGALFIGPYWLINPYQVVTHALSSDPLVARDLGSIEEMRLMEMHVHNYQFSADLRVVGDKNTGSYYADLSPNGSVKLTNYGYAYNQDAMLDIPRVNDVPILPETENSYSGNTVTLISTSFEVNDGIRTQVLPFIQNGSQLWGTSAHAHSGHVSANAIPEGNPGELSYFNKNINAVLLNSQLRNNYVPFDVAQFKQVELDFWRFSTSNPSETHNCLGSLLVEYRLDAGEWQSKMDYCGQNKSLPHEWLESQLVFNTAGHKELEIRFRYEYPPSTRKDATAVYLVDDLKVIGYPN
jgi:hypothetical protein